MWNSTAGMTFLTPVADIGGPVDSVAAFFFKILAVVVAGRTRGTLDAAKNDLFTNVGLSAAEAFFAEVLRVEEEAFAGVILRQPVFTDFLRDRGRILAQIAGNIFE